MDGNLVEQLHILIAESAAERNERLAFGFVIGKGIRDGLCQGYPMQQRREILQCSLQGQAARSHAIGLSQQRGPVAPGQRVEYREKITAIHRAEHFPHRRLVDFSRAVRNRLVEQRQRIAHAALRRA